MSNPLSDFLTASSGVLTPHKDDGFYKNLAKEAAEALVSDGKSMTDTIEKMASEHDLNPEQQKRVSEYANNSAFQQIFQRDPGYVTFPMAEPGDTTKTASVPMLESQRYIAGSENFDTEKLASALFGVTEEVESDGQVMSASELKQMAENLRTGVEDAQSDAINKVAELQRMVGEAVEDEEGSPEDIAKALRNSGVHTDLVKSACAHVQGVEVRHRFGESSIPNDNHPLVKKAKECAKSAANYIKVRGEAEAKAKELLDGVK